MLAMRPLTERSTETLDRISFCLNGSGIVILHGVERTKITYAIDATDLSIVKHIPCDVDVTGEDILNLAYLSYLYALRLADTRMMRRLTKVDRSVVTTTRDNVFLSFDMVKYKIATLRCVIQQLTPEQSERVERNFIACGLKREDAILYYLLYNNNDVQEFIEHIRKIEDRTFTLDVNALPLELEDRKINSEFEKTATYHTNASLRFIVTGNNWSFNDIRNELKLRAVQAYYWVRPFYTQLHSINYAKASLNGYRMELIKYYNQPERARIVRDEQGNFQNVIREITEDVFSAVDIYEQENNMIEYLDYKRAYA